ncbi:glycosyl transferase family protein [Sphingomonas sp. AX6]|uniref:glycosyl transferase family protein n=1 Tax=Sphingomonas sp. AX6 TaxID=2653171 RepID=UPI0012F0D992|nr:glycosyl transferase family protein [Sphingomonas sp. AX6]VXC66640.1 Adsorption protein B [Sphingomonas sp. AX6]
MGDAGWIVGALGFATQELLLFAAIGFLIGGIDDLAIDVVWVREKLRGRLRPVAASSLTPPRNPMAIFVPAWDESSVIGAMLGHLTATLNEPDLRVFVGTYPNDPATIDAVAALAERDSRICLVVLPHPGPTTKADCLNALWRALLCDEGASGRRFAGVVMHDAEDVAHHLELRVLGAMLTDAMAAQLPVLPIAVPGSPLISGHYCDEFVEAHGRQLPVRDALGAALPLAGVGCALRRDLLVAIAARRGGDPFDASSLTEDYELGLAVAREGGRTRFARAIDDDGAPVAVRGYFPDTVDAAVRQKARWMTGIALAGWDRTGWGHRASPVEWWMRMRDRRAILAVITLACAYLGLVMSGVLFLTTGAFGPVGQSAVTWLLLATAFLLLWRVIWRTYWVAKSYGGCTALLALPRLIVGNVIAMLAARRAMVQYLGLMRGKALHWDKTAHHFPSKAEIGA